MKRLALALLLALTASAASAEVWVVGPQQKFLRPCPTPNSKPDKDVIAPPVYVPPAVVEPVKKDDTLVKVVAAVAAAVVGGVAGVAVQWKKTHPSV